MKIQYTSDLHLEFESNRLWLQYHPIQPKGDILILAGDTTHFREDYFQDPFFDQISNDFREVYMIPGNHEYYGGWDTSQAYPFMQKQIRDNVNMVNNVIIETEEADLIFTTLWTKIRNNQFYIMNGIADFRYINYRDEKLTIQTYNKLFDESYKFLKRSLTGQKAKKTVVVTHHLPSTLCNAEEFQGSLLNEAFCVDLTDFIKKSKPDFWVYGHSHRNKEPFKIGETLMLTNQMGYVDHGEDKDFMRDAVFEV